jgi:hypothetical protein
MLNRSNKRREMARSILPSTGRKGAAIRLAAIRRAHRRSVRQKLTIYSGRSPVAYVAEDSDLGDDANWPTHRIREVVVERRDHDKVAPLIRWAVATTKTTRLEDRLSGLAVALPPGLIGQHAISHLEFLDELAPDYPHRHHYYWYRRGLTGSPRWSQEELSRRVRTAVERGGHAELNHRLKYVESPRLFHGLHDLEEFVKWLDTRGSRIRPGSAGESTEYEVVRRFLIAQEA